MIDQSEVKSIAHRTAVAKQGLRAVLAEYDVAQAELEAMRAAKAAEFRDWELKIERLKSIAANLETHGDRR